MFCLSIRGLAFLPGHLYLRTAPPSRLSVLAGHSILYFAPRFVHLAIPLGPDLAQPTWLGLYTTRTSAHAHRRARVQYIWCLVSRRPPSSPLAPTPTLFGLDIFSGLFVQEPVLIFPLLAYPPLSGLRATWCPALPCPGPVSLAHFLSASLPFLPLLPPAPTPAPICLCICTCVGGYIHAHLCPRSRVRAARLRILCSSRHRGSRDCDPACLATLVRSLNHQLARSLACSPTQSKLTGAVSRFSHTRDPQAKTTSEKEKNQQRTSKEEEEEEGEEEEEDGIIL